MVCGLKRWGSEKNTSRSDVIPKGAGFVFSDTFGALGGTPSINGHVLVGDDSFALVRIHSSRPLLRFGWMCCLGVLDWISECSLTTYVLLRL